MPSKKDETEEVVKNVEFDEEEKKKSKKQKKVEVEDEEDDDTSESDEQIEDDNDDDDEDDDEEEEDEDNDTADALTDMGLYNVLGNFLVDEDGNTIGASMSNIAKELSKLTHILKKYTKNS